MAVEAPVARSSRLAAPRVRLTPASSLPLWIGGAYLLTTLVLFLISPFNWPITNWASIYVYLPAAFAILLAAARAGTMQVPRGPSRLPAGLNFIWIGAIAAIVLIIPSSKIYTGRWPWEFMAALADQTQAYHALAEQLDITEGIRAPLAIARALAGPFTFAVLPLGIMHWRALTNIERGLVVATVITSALFSILRGTTREVADLFIIALSAGLVILGRLAHLRGISAGQSILRRWRLVVVAGLAAFGVLFVLVGHTQGRLAPAQGRVCLGESLICADFNRAPYNHMSDDDAFALATITAYASQGYFGLALAQSMDFEPTWGVGHSPAVSQLYTQLTGDRSLPAVAYTARMTNLGWSDTTQWSSLITWIANDVGFYVALAVLAALGWAWGLSWNDATRGFDDRAGIAFCVYTQMIFYLPANNQLMMTYEGYATLVGWSVLWIGTRGKRLAGGVPTGAAVAVGQSGGAPARSVAHS